MKAILIIFAGYLFLLSCFPCMCDDRQENQSALKSNIAASHTGSNSKDDNCNPFCSCTCCLSSTFVYQKELLVAAPVVFCNPRNFPRTDQQFISYNAHAIWQPPKLS